MDKNLVSELNLKHTLEGHKDRVWNVTWSPNGELLASCSGDKTIRIWHRKGEAWVTAQILQDHERAIRRIAFSPDMQFLISASFDSTCSLYKLQDGEFKLICHLEGHENEVKGVAWDSTGTLIATCSRDKSVWIFEKDQNMQVNCESVCSSHTQDVKTVLWHPKHEVLISCSYDDTMKVWRRHEDDWICHETVIGHKSTVWDATFEKHQGNYLVSVGDDKSLILWRFTYRDQVGGVLGEHQYFKKLQEIKGHLRTIYSVDWSRVEPFVVSGGADDTIRIFKVSNFAQNNDQDVSPSLDLASEKERAHSGDINCVAWHPSEMILASCGDDKVIKIWSYSPPTL